MIDVTGPAGGQWTLTTSPDGWRLSAGALDTPSTRVTLRDDLAWKLLFNALRGAEATAAVRVEGRPELATPFFRARSVIV